MSKKLINIKNKKSSYEYEYISKYVSGIMLKGTEIKSIRHNEASISESYCVIINKEIWVRNLHISEYRHSSEHDYNPIRERKLLLKKTEIEKIHDKVKTKGVTIIPIRLFINERGKAKLEIAIAKGKKIFDKRESIKLKDVKKKINRVKKQF